MIQQWVLEKIDHLRNERLILVRDPQRMIRPGAQAVDGWAKDNGFTALLCSGNLALREMYEQIRDDSSAKVILVDRSRDNARLPLFYPDLAAQCSSRARVRITLKDFLVEQTGDGRWPSAVNERNLSRLILENLEGTLKAHGQLRDVDPLRFTDDDLYKIVVGATLGLNPFQKMRPRDIRRLCIEFHDKLDEINHLFSAGGVEQAAKVLQTFKDQIAQAQKPWCWMLEHDPHAVVRAFTLAAILHQHDLEYQTLLGSLDAGLAPYQGIPKKSVSQTLSDMLKADPDRMAADVAEVEDFLREEPQKRLALVLSGQCKIEDAANAKKVLLAERLSPLIRGMALLSLLADLLIGRKIAFHREVLAALDDEGTKSTKELSLAARRPTQQWTTLLSAYRRAIEYFEIAECLHQHARKLKVAKTEQLQFEWFHDIWNKDRVDCLDFYGSELKRLLRVGDLLPIRKADFWPNLTARWEQANTRLTAAIDSAETDLDVVNTKFQDLYRAHYIDWIKQDNAPAIFTHQFLARVLKTHWDQQSGKKAIILVFDGLRTDAWRELVQPVLEEKYDVLEELPGSAIIPTETHLSRKAISAGCLPVDFSSTTERVLLEDALKTHLGLEIRFNAEKEEEDVEAGIAARFTSDKMEMVIFGFTDKNLHNNHQDLAFIYTATVREILRQDVRSVLREMPDDATVFVVSDHGFCPVNADTFTVPHTVVMDARDVKYRVGRLKYPLEGDDATKAVVFKVADLGIPEQVPGGKWSCKHVAFPRPGLTLKRHQGRHDPESYTHGGLSMAECLIPMAVLGPKVEFRPAFELVDLRFEGTPVEGESLDVEIVVTARAEQSVQDEILFQLSTSLDEIQPRKDVFVGSEQTYRIRWRPKTEDATPDEQQEGKMVRQVTVIASYRWQNRTVRTSQHGSIDIKLDTTRIRRRLDSRLDSIMGMVPKGLR